MRFSLLGGKIVLTNRVAQIASHIRLAFVAVVCAGADGVFDDHQSQRLGGATASAVAAAAVATGAARWARTRNAWRYIISLLAIISGGSLNISDCS